MWLLGEMLQIVQMVLPMAMEQLGMRRVITQFFFWLLSFLLTGLSVFCKGVCIHVEKKSSLLTKTSKLIQKTNNLAILFSFYDNPGEIHIYTKRTSINSFCCKKRSKSMKNAFVFIQTNFNDFFWSHSI